MQEAAAPVGPGPTTMRQAFCAGACCHAVPLHAGHPVSLQLYLPVL